VVLAVFNTVVVLEVQVELVVVVLVVLVLLVQQTIDLVEMEQTDLVGGLEALLGMVMAVLTQVLTKVVVVLG
jgi:hypothetical protein